MQVRDLMRHEVASVSEDATLAECCDLFQQMHVHGAPVIDAAGRLVGFVSQEDILFGGMGVPRPVDLRKSAKPGSGKGPPEAASLRARDVMTSPAVAATEDTELVDVCRLMWRLRIHHVPVVRGEAIIGILSAMDLCRAVSEGTIHVPVSRDSGEARDPK